MRCYLCERTDLKPEDFSPGNNRCRSCHTQYQKDRRAKLAEKNQNIDLSGVKRCSTCQLEKPKTEFGLAKGVTDGLQPQCNNCRSVTRKKYNTTVKGHIQNMVAGARRRSKLTGKEFNITVKDVEVLWDLQRGKCRITDLPMELENNIAYCRNSRNLFGPSLDRVDNNKGYRQDNIQLTLTAVNLGLNHWGLEVFRETVVSIAQKRGYTVIAPTTPT